MNKSVGFSELARQLAYWLRDSGVIVIMGIGNPIRRDDFVGMATVRQLERIAPKNVRVIEAGEVPESYLGRVEELRPSHVLMIDAAEMGEHPGSVRLVSPRKIEGFSLSTHTLPLSVVSEYLAKRTKAKIALLAIQPKDLDFGEGLSSELSERVGTLAKAIGEAIKLSGKKRVKGQRPPKRVRQRSAR